MASNRANALKQLIESGGLSLAAYKDSAPASESRPYCTVGDGISTIPNGAPDGGDETDCTELAQVSLWEDYQEPDGTPMESPTLADDLARLLHGAQLVDAPMRVHGVSVVDKRRLVDNGRNVVQTAITVRLRRAL
jgi:hypothetical protein